MRKLLCSRAVASDVTPRTAAETILALLQLRGALMAVPSLIEALDLATKTRNSDDGESTIKTGRNGPTSSADSSSPAVSKFASTESDSRSTIPKMTRSTLRKEPLSASGEDNGSPLSRKGALFRGIASALRSSAFPRIAKFLSAALDEDAFVEGGHRGRNRTEEMVQIAFALRSGVCGKLDVERNRFVDSLEKINALFAELKEGHPDPSHRSGTAEVGTTALKPHWNSGGSKEAVAHTAEQSSMSDGQRSGSGHLSGESTLPCHQLQLKWTAARGYYLTFPKKALYSSLAAGTGRRIAPIRTIAQVCLFTGC